MQQPKKVVFVVPAGQFLLQSVSTLHIIARARDEYVGRKRHFEIYVSSASEISVPQSLTDDSGSGWGVAEASPWQPIVQLIFD
jgi:hypothetical protein